MKPHRLRSARDFQRVYAEGARKAGKLLVVYRCPAEGALRVGVAVGRRVGKAVARNRIRRRLREILRQLPLAGAQDLVVSARPQAAGASFWELREELWGLLQELGALRGEGVG
ncbi:MAG: ribonuclease P protein component [Armatimonadota bacterium]|nr:ribonuclease P protein component [Armatimonadota bacterium]MDR7461633.1 ribonuclease P protein component [Armatimonadota bacterium]MDR7477932.1 ribonuclease P protein component [Armatimonadota bacterium]MDR7541708.1 ribonuclease P protein component [Armatimonadota bacterium]MDR7577306.1 ribonuclease P protein component [Armatimonadota bacterium]